MRRDRLVRRGVVQDMKSRALEPLARTAAREAEEETHWQLRAEEIEPKLADCHMIWCVGVCRDRALNEQDTCVFVLHLAHSF